MLFGDSRFSSLWLKTNLLKNGKLDARMTIGVGNISYEYEQVVL